MKRNALSARKKEQKLTLLRNVFIHGKGWRKVKVAEGRLRGWERRLDTVPTEYGPGVTELGQYILRWFERRNGESVPVYKFLEKGIMYAAASEAYKAKRDVLAGYQPEQPEPVENPVLMDTGAKRLAQPESTRLGVFIKDRKAVGHITCDSTIMSYEWALKEFIALTGVRCAEDVTDVVLSDYLTKLRAQVATTGKALAPGTVFDRYIRVCSVLENSATEEQRRLFDKYKPPQVQRPSISYTEDEVEVLLEFIRQHPDDYPEGKLELMVEMLYKTGVRNKELAYLSWDIIDLESGFITKGLDNRKFVFNYHGKTRQVTFRTKKRRDRLQGIPIEQEVLTKLRAWRDRPSSDPKQRLVFPNQNGTPHHNLLELVRVAVNHAGLNCGVCEKCQAPCGDCANCRCNKCWRCKKQRSICKSARMNPDKRCLRTQCTKWNIHRFRHTCGTVAVDHGVDPVTVKDIFGHADLRTTNTYLSAVKEKRAQEKINKAFRRAGVEQIDPELLKRIAALPKQTLEALASLSGLK